METPQVRDFGQDLDFGSVHRLVAGFSALERVYGKPCRIDCE